MSLRCCKLSRTVRPGRSIAALALSATLSCYAYSQGITASVGGTVVDASGAAIPGASVSLRNENSTDIRTIKSNGAGVFNFSAVPVGDYQLTIQMTGFSTFTVEHVHLDPGDTKTVRDLNLKVGAETTVDVQEADQQIPVDSGEISSLISAQKIEELSIQGRDVTELFKILPGFAINNGSGGVDNTAYDPSQVTATGALGNYRANGAPFSGIALISDGADITDPGNFGQAMQTVNYDQVAEVKIQTSSFGADTARGPVVVNAVGKAGGSNYHGALYIYARTYQLNSADWLANYTRQPKPQDRQLYPGFTLGGPVLIPGTGFNRFRKLTFFVGAEQYAQRNIYAYGSAAAATISALVPTTAMRAGDFSPAALQQYLGPAYKPNASGPGCGGTYANVCYVPQTGPKGEAIANGNISRFIDPGAAAELNAMPLPNLSSTTGTAGAVYNYITTNLTNNNLWQAKGRLDYAVTEKHKLFASYSDERGRNGVPQIPYYSPRAPMGAYNTPGGGMLSDLRSEFGTLNLTSLFGSTLTNQLQFSGGYFKQIFRQKNFAATNTYPYGNLFNYPTHVLPQLSDYGYNGLPISLIVDTTSGGPVFAKFVRTVADDVTKVIGKHTLRAGAFFQLDSNNQVTTAYYNVNGTVNASYFPESFNDPVQGTVRNTGAVGSANGGNYLANFLEGHVAAYSQASLIPKANLYFKNFDGYIQDHFLVTPGLSIDFGVRFEHLAPWSDAHNLGIPVFDAASYTTPLSPVLPGFRWHGLDKSIPSSGFATRTAFIEPRGGFAWDPHKTGETVLRGGFGIYRAHDAYVDVSGAAGTLIGYRQVSTNNLLLSSVPSRASVTTAGNGFVPYSSVTGVDGKDDNQPQVITYNLSVDQKLPRGTLFELAYVGNVARHLLNNGANSQASTLNNVNALPIGTLFGAQPTGVRDANGNLVSNGGKVYPLFAPPGVSGSNTALTNLDTQHIDAFRPYPLYTRLNVNSHNLSSNYNGLQLTLNRQQGSLHYGVAYTWSKALGILGSQGNGFPSNPFNLQDNYQEEAFDRRHIFSATYSYAVGKVAHQHFVGGLVNGWLISGITVAQSGAPLAAANNPNYGIGGQIALVQGTTTQNLTITNTNILGTPDVFLQPRLICDPHAVGGKNQIFNGSCFAAPLLGTNGPYRYGRISNPAYISTDLTVGKTFHLHDTQAIQFKVAAFNVINRANRSFSTATAPTALMLNFTGNTFNTADPNAGLAAARSVNPDFGYANLKEGRRIMEVSFRYNF